MPTEEARGKIKYAPSGREMNERGRESDEEEQVPKNETEKETKDASQKKR